MEKEEEKIAEQNLPGGESKGDFSESDQKAYEDKLKKEQEEEKKSIPEALFHKKLLTDDTKFLAIATLPEDGSNPEVLSEKIAVGPLSFVDGKQAYDKNARPPTYFSLKELQEKLPATSAQILKGLDKTDEGGLVCTDEESIEKQRGVLTDVLKQLAKNMLQGLTITHISLPVRIFEPYSTLQRIINLFSFMPKYLPQAAAQTDPLERMKLVIASAISGSYLCTGQLKPFNPILGETLQCHFSDGTQILCEHTSHHPPISNFTLEPPDNSYQFHGYYEFTAKMGANNMRAGQRGPNVVRFNDG